MRFKVMTRNQFKRMQKAGHRSPFEARCARFSIECRKRRTMLKQRKQSERSIKPVFE